MSSDLQSSPGMGKMILSGMATLTYRVGTLFLGLSSLLAVFLYFKQDSMLYFPEISGLPRRPSENPAQYRSPEEHQIPFENIFITCKDGVQIHAWLMMRTKEKNDLPTLIFFHGNAGNMGLRIPNVLNMMQRLNVNVMAVDYRGYGESDSVAPNEAGLKLDAEAALNYISKHPKIDPAKLFLFGRSLGGAVAFHLADYAEKNGINLAGVIVENTFKSIATMVDHLMPQIAPLKSLILRIGWDSMIMVPSITAPILLLAGKRDELVPHSHMKQLFGAAVKSRLLRFHAIEKGTHNDTWVKGGKPYWEAMKSFILDALQLKGTSARIESSTAPAKTGESNKAASIPIMPSNLLGIARESIREGHDADSTIGKKEL